jgi:hypothetical protein
MATSTCCRVPLVSARRATTIQDLCLKPKHCDFADLKRRRQGHENLMQTSQSGNWRPKAEVVKSQNGNCILSSFTLQMPKFSTINVFHAEVHRHSTCITGSFRQYMAATIWMFMFMFNLIISDLKRDQLRPFLHHGRLSSFLRASISKPLLPYEPRKECASSHQADTYSQSRSCGLAITFFNNILEMRFQAPKI